MMGLEILLLIGGTIACGLCMQHATRKEIADAAPSRKEFEEEKERARELERMVECLGSRLGLEWRIVEPQHDGKVIDLDKHRGRE